MDRQAVNTSSSTATVDQAEEGRAGYHRTDASGQEDKKTRDASIGFLYDMQLSGLAPTERTSTVKEG